MIFFKYVLCGLVEVYEVYFGCFVYFEDECDVLLVSEVLFFVFNKFGDVMIV